MSGQLLFRHRVQLRSGGARLHHAVENLENLENHPVGLIHDRDLIASLENRPFHAVEHLLQRPFNSFKDLIDGTNPVDLTQNAFRLVKRRHRKRLPVKRFQSLADRLLGIVRTSHNLRAATIADEIVRRRSRFQMVDRSAFRT